MDFESFASAPDVVRQRIQMPAVQVAGLREPELALALAYEIEPFSNIPPTEAEVRFEPRADSDPTVRVFDVAVRRTRRNAASAAGSRWLWVATACGLALLLILALDAVLVHRRVAGLARLADERRPLQAHLDRLRGETRTMRQEAADVRARREAGVRAQDEAARLRTATADLLEVLSVSCGSRAVISSIASDRSAMAVRAVASSAEAASTVMRELTVRATKAGWRLVPGAIDANRSGSTVSFDFNLSYGER